MQKSTIFAACLGAVTTTSWAETEKRCGWYLNPTPANHWLEDADGLWTLAIQGGYQIWNETPTEVTDFDFGDQWVSSNGDPDHTYYGHGCACLDGTFDAETGLVLELTKVTPLPLQTCRADPNLPEEIQYGID